MTVGLHHVARREAWGGVLTKQGGAAKRRRTWALSVQARAADGPPFSIMLSLSVDPEKFVQRAQDEEALRAIIKARREGQGEPVYHHAHAGRYGTKPIPKFELPEEGLSERETYELLKGELSLDGKPSLNLASFVHTWMPEEATQLMTDTIGINLCDQDEYPATMAIHARCVTILSNLWKAPKSEDHDGRSLAALGTATTGSSEAIMLGLLTAKRRWQAKMKAQGKDIHNPGPNLVFGANVQVAIEKFARYWEVEERPVPVTEESHYCLDPKKAMEFVDENTIAVVVILGSTYTGHYEPVEEMAELLDEYEAKTGIDIPIHVDGASGAMVAPFATPDHKWSFDIPRVASINTSGHKFGMVYPGIGWIIFRSSKLVPSELVFELHYLGSVEYSFGLNFSRPAAPMLGQMFNFISLGRQGFVATMEANLMNARLLSRALEYSGLFVVLSDIHRPATKQVEATTEAAKYVPGLPVVAFRWTDEVRKEFPHMEQHSLQVRLRSKGWIVPNYELPPSLEKIEILRVVVRDNMTENMIDVLVHDIISMTRDLMEEQKRMHHYDVADALELAREMRYKAKISGGRHGHHARPVGLGQPSRGHNSQC